MLGVGKELIQNISDGVHSDCGKPEKKAKQPLHSASVDKETSGTPPPVLTEDDPGNCSERYRV